MDEVKQQVLELLRDNDADIVRHAVEALEKIDEGGCEQIASALLSAIESAPDEVIPDLMNGLVQNRRQCGDEDLHRLLEQLSAHQRPIVRVQVLETLRDIIGPSDRRLLLERFELEDTPSVLAVLISCIDERLACDEIVDALVRSTLHVDAGVRSAALSALERVKAEVPGDRLDALLEDPSSQVRINAMRLKWTISPVETRRMVLADLEAADMKRRHCALELLSILRPFDGVERILAENLKDDSVHVRRLAARGLGSLDRIERPEPIVRAFCRERDGEVRELLEKIIASRSSSARDGVVALFDHIVRNEDTRNEERAVASRGLAVVGGPEAMNVIIEVVEDEDPRVRANAIDGISRWAGEDDDCRRKAADLLETMLDDPSPRVRANAALELHRLGADGALSSLLEMLSSGDCRQQGCAAFALGEIGTEEVVKPLSEALNRLTSLIVATDDQIFVMDNIKRALRKIHDGRNGRL